jgi:hypothetical protein
VPFLAPVRLPLLLDHCPSRSCGEPTSLAHGPRLGPRTRKPSVAQELIVRERAEEREHVAAPRGRDLDPDDERTLVRVLTPARVRPRRDRPSCRSLVVQGSVERGDAAVVHVRDVTAKLRSDWARSLPMSSALPVTSITPRFGSGYAPVTTTL